MIPQNKNQPGPPGVITLWGHPWHGLVEDGVLTLPNAATMAYPAPSGEGEADVLVFQVPGTPAVTRTPEQTAADAAAGRQWLDHAIISGRSTRRLYGQAIGGNGSWLYAAPDGSRWLVTLADVPGTYDLTTAWTATLTCARFGEFGAAPESHDLTVTLADWQQDIPGKPGGDWFIYGMAGGEEDVTSGRVTVEDVNATGSQAILMISVAFPGDPIYRRSLGFLMVDLSGTPGVDADANLGVLRSRADTLGIISAGLDGPLDFTLVDVTPADPPHVTTTAFVGSATYSASLTGRIIAMAFDASGTAIPLQITCNNTSTTISEAPAGSAYPMTWHGSNVLSATASLSWGPGSVEFTVTIASDISSTMFYEDLSVWVTRSSATEWTGPLGTYSVGGSATENADSGAIIGSILGADRSVIVGFPVSPAVSPTVDGFRADVGGLGNTETSSAQFLLQRTSHRLIDVIVQETGVAWHYWIGLSPLSSAGTVIESVALLPYGSAHPVTGEIARARDVPVCWV